MTKSFTFRVYRARQQGALLVLSSLALCSSLFAQDVTSEPTPRQGEAPADAIAASEGGGADGASPPARRLSDRSELDRVIEVYLQGNYDTCSSELGRFLDEGNPGRFQEAPVIERARLYYATCSLLQGERQQARDALSLALSENPLMQSPDSLTFPPPVVSLFLEVRDEVQLLIAEREKEQVVELRRENEAARRKAEARMRREQELEKLAREESVIVQNSRWIAAIPFGAGQFQNGNQGLGNFFLVSEGLAAGTMLTSALIMSSLTSQDRATIERNRGKDGHISHNKDVNATYQVMKWSSWSFLGLALIGIAEAQFRYEPERVLETRQRELPPSLMPQNEQGQLDEGAEAVPSNQSSRQSRGVRITPLIGASPEFGFLGIAGRF